MTQRRPAHPQGSSTYRRRRQWAFRFLSGGAIALSFGGALAVFGGVAAVFTPCEWGSSCRGNDELVPHLLWYSGALLIGLGVVGLLVALILFFRLWLLPEVSPMEVRDDAQQLDMALNVEAELTRMRAQDMSPSEREAAIQRLRDAISRHRSEGERIADTEEVAQGQG
jgi:hypothetical protein